MIDVPYGIDEEKPRIDCPGTNAKFAKQLEVLQKAKMKQDLLEQIETKAATDRLEVNRELTQDQKNVDIDNKELETYTSERFKDKKAKEGVNAKAWVE